MPTRSMEETMDAFGGMLDDVDAILRAAHARYRGYNPEHLIEHDMRAQTACTYAHAVAEADRVFLANPKVHPLEIRGLKLWIVDDLNAALRMKKMDEDGKSRNYPTKQAKDYDSGKELPGLPVPPVRLTIGYLLDATNVNFVRTQIARPSGSKNIMWCAAVVPSEDRKIGERAWVEVTRGMSL